MYEMKTIDVYQDFIKDKAMFHVSHYSAKPQLYDNSSKLVVDKMKDETNY